MKSLNGLSSCLALAIIIFSIGTSKFVLGEEECPGKRQDRLVDQAFGMSLTPDDLLTSVMSPWIIHDYFRPWRHLAALTKDLGSTIKTDKDKFLVNLDVQHFAPEEISVKTADGYVVVEAKHEEKKDEHGFVSRQFVRKYSLPEGAESDDVVSQLSSDGILTIYKDTNKAVKHINSDLHKIVEWSEHNSLLLNPSKSKFMIVGSRLQRKTIMEAKPTILINGEHIDMVNVACSLGLTIDSELRFETHISTIARNCFYRLKILYSIREYVNVEIRKQLIESLVLSKLNYCDTVYGPCLLKRTEKLIQRIQNACARYCLQIPKRSYITPYLNQNDILKMAARRKLHLSCLLFGVIAKQKPKYLYDKLAWRQSRSQLHALRAAINPLLTSKHRTVAFEGCFKHAATRCWNDIPPPIRDLKSVNSFKYHLKKHLLQAQQNDPTYG